MKVGGGRGEGRFPSFLPHPLPALLLAPFFVRSLTLVPRSLLLNDRTERLATQSRGCNNENKETKKEQRSKENWIKVKSRTYQIFEEPFVR